MRDGGTPGSHLDQSRLAWITNFIWGTADDVLRDLFVRGEYRDVILPVTVLRRLDTTPEPTKQQAVLAMKATPDGTGIATYVWVLTNHKPEHRRGKVQPIDATAWYRPLRKKNHGKKNGEPSEADVARVVDTFLAFEESEQSKIVPNAALGHQKLTVERPLRLRGLDPERAYTPRELKAPRATAERDESASPVIRKVHRAGKVEPDPWRGLFAATVAGRACVVEYEPDPELRDTEQVPLLEPGGIDAFLTREVLPHAADAWYDPARVRVGYEISLTGYFDRPQPLRTLEEVRADILAVERETEGVPAEIVGAE